ncbi:amino acid permease [Saitoella complicata NRRL Y-17804]|uniref:Amino acid permease/ SLC12A domain-containing protein n=1 Tax=Saitoella complicata (strain BCRC 22490 / CBS 7301 / JCM 7358 / NBRC 10748 / NRRL Y-17804) TaxID=698492 RepID=A0A0E9NRZ8_SAICN|nr:amino acid permease [Saitoella complicata NRRL Y-17804]ODQ52230.1 amino acid permease [Saitoella complicata NRRL Y-17804]GAO52649.1 hypothetical protein G7K_6721-t1 [Saitoella complicata NRRL Y-17804]
MSSKAPIELSPVELGSRDASPHFDGSRENTLVVDDDAKLAQLGYKQEFVREFTSISTFSFAFSIMGVLASITSTFIYPLMSGGPAAVVWCWFAGSIFAFCLACSVAELVSAYPTSGGLYYTTKHLVPKKYVPVVAWCTGWLNLLGQTAGVASTDFALAQMILAGATMGSKYDAETGLFAYTPTNNHTVGVYVAIICFHGLWNSLPTKWFASITKYFAFINIAASIAVVATLFAKQDTLHSPSYVFGHVENNSGWSSTGFSFILGFLSVAWTMTDYDATAHIAEETHKAAIRAPVAIVSAVTGTFIVGLLLNITFAFTMGDPTLLTSSQTGMPISQLLYNVVGRKGALAIWPFIILVQNFTAVTALSATARTAFALARDQALPWSSQWAKMNKTVKIPLNAVWLIVVCCILLGLIALGSTEAIFAIFSLTSIAMDCSYIIPISARLIWGEQLGYTPGPFNLGFAGKVMSVISIVWVLFISTVLCFPTYMPVTPQNMNYAVVVLTGVALFSVFWWYVDAHKWYVGPRDNLEEAEAEALDYKQTPEIAEVRAALHVDDNSHR